MGELRKGGSAAWAVGITLAALLALYVVAYYATVFRLPASMQSPYSPYSAPTTQPRYRIGPLNNPKVYETWVGAFAPMHWLDRRLRPDFWKNDALGDWLREE